MREVSSTEAVFSFRLTEMEMMQWLWFLCVFIAGISGSVNSLYHVFSVCYWYSHVIDLFFFEESMRGSPFFDCSWFWIVINCDGTHWNWWEGYSYPYRQQSPWVCWVLGFSLGFEENLSSTELGKRYYVFGDCLLRLRKYSQAKVILLLLFNF